MFKYGFNPASGNFQDKPLTTSRAGGDGDPVVINVQDGSAANNANFAAGPDGIPGVVRLGLFNSATPPRDSSLDSDVVFHELTHGVSSRLTGGAGNANCLSSPLSGGMGEGWSDIIALIFRMTPQDTRAKIQPVGAYVANDPKGIRSFPYSTNKQVNPLMYESLLSQSARDVHRIGEVWTEMLFEAYWNMVDANGFNPNLSDTGNQKGNTQFLQLLIDGMKLQPCNPDFVQARDAILRADQNNNGGRNRCLLLKGFAKRGLGMNARGNDFRNNFDLPAGC
jgi:hypothetical protein